MTRATEDFRVVTGRTVRLPGICFARVSIHIVVNVVSALPGPLMTARAVVLLVTAGAAQSARRGSGAVRTDEVVRMHANQARRVDACRVHGERHSHRTRGTDGRNVTQLYASTGFGLGQRIDPSRAEQTRVTRSTARLRVTRCA